MELQCLSFVVHDPVERFHIAVEGIAAGTYILKDILSRQTSGMDRRIQVQRRDHILKRDLVDFGHDLSHAGFAGIQRKDHIFFIKVRQRYKTFR